MTDDLPVKNARLLERLDERTLAMDRKLDRLDLTVQEELTNLKTEICTELKDHENRIRALEKGAWLRDGLAAIAGGVTGFFAGLAK